MGCGKTVQVLGLLSALFEKTGTGADVWQIQRRQELIRAEVQQQNRDEEAALQQGRILNPEHSKSSLILSPKMQQELQLPARWWPSLIVVPATVMENWQNEIAKFTHFSVACYDGKTKDKDNAVVQLCSGIAEIMLIKRSTFQDATYFREINSMPVRWKLVIIDEFHTWKVSVCLGVSIDFFAVDTRCV